MRRNLRNDINRWRLVVESALNGLTPNNIVLYHNGPPNLPNNRPSQLAAYFGTEEFADSEGFQFGPVRYSYRVPPEIAQRILDLHHPSPIVKDFLSRWLEMDPRDDSEEYDEALVAGDYDAVYEMFSDWTPSLLETIRAFRLAGLKLD